MKRLLISSAILLGLASMLFAAEPFDAATQYILGASSAITGSWTYYVVDTFTITPSSLTQHINFGAKPLYNVKIEVLNAAGDSGYITVTPTDFVGGVVHANSVAKAYKAGDVWRADTAVFYMGLRSIDILAKKGGTADLAVIVRITGMR